MMRGLLSGAGGGGGRSYIHTSRGATSTGSAAGRVFATEGEPLWAECEARHAVTHVLMQIIEKAHYIQELFLLLFLIVFCFVF